VDDEPILHELYRDMLKIKGHEIAGVAFNGMECLISLSNSGKDPDFILMDHRMPIKNGLDTMKELLRTKPYLKIIFVSADLKVKKEALNVGAVLFLKKPFNLQTFLKSINTLMN
jgi:two-component system chemotaxis response regulator CheY